MSRDENLDATGLTDAQRLLRSLVDAAAEGNQITLRSLCKEGEALVRENFVDWKVVPDELRADPRKGRVYVETLIAVAQCFAEEMKDTSLLEVMMAGPEDNPITQWQSTLAAVADLWEQHEYERAIERLEETIQAHEEVHGTAVDSFLPISLGRLGESYFHAGRAEEAVAPLTRALELATKEEDVEALLASLGSLYEVHRYLGQTQDAGRIAEHLAIALEKSEKNADAADARKKAEQVRAGEPLNRVVVLVDGEMMEVEDLTTPPTQSIQFIFQRNRMSMKAAEAEVERGRELGSEDKFEEALAAFDRAIELDPYDPEPHYDRGFTLMHMQRYADAIDAYAKVEELAPGWFNSRSDAWLAQRLADGSIEHPVFLALVALEDGPQPAEDKVQLASAMLDSGIDLPLLRLLLGINLTKLGHHDVAAAHYQKGLDSDPEPHVKTRLLTQLGIPTPDFAGDRDALEQAAELGGSLVAAAQAKVALLLTPS